MVFKAQDLWDESHWYALQTRSRHEKLVHSELHKKGFESFLPLRSITRQWSDRKKRVELPLFSGYLFVQLALSEKFKVLQTVGAVRLIGFNGSPCPVPERDLSAIRRFLEEKIAIDPFPYLAVGDRVYIRSGRFKGVEGFIVRKDRHTRLVVSLDLLMQSVSVGIDEALVERV